MELLAPAGSMEALRAAVCNGADAVYLGADTFNARMNARNFSAADLQEAVVYCHVRGVKVHLTLNTLVLDREMQRAADLIRMAAAFGVDAFIVQDLGVVSLCRQLAPDVPIHASTQMSIHSLEGVMEAAALGCSRVVLARELPAEEIAHICKKSPVEIEVFVHGALCMCYSGQCYLSSVIGRRSGNRGQCAQPCRLPYGYGRFESTRYPLSLKDNCLVEYLDDLRRLGVSSLKIEGRMKRPEYVAVVTKAYRSALDGKRVTQSDLRELESVFSRQGFTQGYYEGKTGPAMFGIRQEPEDNRELFAAARATYESGENVRIPVRFYAMIRRGEPAQLAVEDDEGHVCKVAGPIAQEAQVRELTEDERLFYTWTLQCHIDIAKAVWLDYCDCHMLDTIAREPLWRHLINYRCGTGHSVSFVGNVHEGPHALNGRNTTLMRPGMIVTDEPGVYETDLVGIRIENELVCVHKADNQYGTFLAFRPLTFVPIATSPILPGVLDKDEIAWLNDYHHQVFAKLAPHLNAEERVWLAEKCASIGC